MSLGFPTVASPQPHMPVSLISDRFLIPLHTGHLRMLNKEHKLFNPHSDHPKYNQFLLVPKPTRSNIFQLKFMYDISSKPT